MKKIFTVPYFLIFLMLAVPAYAQNDTLFTVYGRVYDTDGVTPLNGITVTLTIGSSSTSTTTANGSLANGTPVMGYYYFPVLPSGATTGTSMTISASTTGKSKSTTVAKSATDPQNVDLTLSTTTTGGGTGGGGSGNGGTGGGGGGGGGGSTGEEYSNILARESKDEIMSVGIPAKYSYSSPASPISEIHITSNVNAGLITTQIEVLKGRSSLIKEDAPGKIYKYLNIWVGTSNFGTSKNIKEAIIKFKVETSWIDSNKFTDTDISLMRWDGTKWTPLETKLITKEGTFTSFEAKTNAFSPFAITSLKGTAIEAPTPVVTVTAKPTITATEPTPVPTKKTSGFEFVLAIVAFVGILTSMRIRR